MKVAVEEPENPTSFWANVFRHGFGTMSIFLSLSSYTLIVLWLEHDELGDGLGPRPKEEKGVNTVTAQYFNWHPFLMSTAFLLLMTPGVIAFELYPFSRSTNKNIHSLLMTLSTLAAFAGFFIIIDCHTNLSDTGTFNTPHSIAGLFTLIIVALNFLGGFFMYFLKLGGTLRSELKPFHKRAGLSAIMLGLATIVMGVQENKDKKSLEDTPLKFSFAIISFVYATLICIVFTVAKFNDKSDGYTAQQQSQRRQDFTRIRDASTDNTNKRVMGASMAAASVGGQYNSLASDRDKNSFNPIAQE